MVKIKRENHELAVTIGAFKDIFEPLGYTLVTENKNKYKNEMPKIKTGEIGKTENKGKGKKQED